MFPASASSVPVCVVRRRSLAIAAAVLPIALLALSVPCAAQEDAQVQKAVVAALGWLARHQEPDGRWSAEKFPARCHPPSTCAGPGYPEYDVGVTALALLAFLHAGFDRTAPEILGGTPAGTVVEHGLRWLAGRADASDAVGGKSNAKYMYVHAIATQALVMAAADDGPVPRATAQKALEYLVNAQNPGRGWRYTFRSGDSDTSLTGWALAAVDEARARGFSAPDSVDNGVRAWLAEVTGTDARVGYTERGTGKVAVQGKNEMFDHNEALAAIGICLRKLCGGNSWRREKAVGEGALLLMKNLPSWRPAKIDFYYWYHGTRAMAAVGGKSWTAWSGAVRDALLKNQLPESAGCAAGSWTEKDRWSFEGGRVYGTAINVLTLAQFWRKPAPAAAAEAKKPEPPRTVAPDDEAASLLRRASNLEKNGALGKARELYQAIVDHHPQSDAAVQAREHLKVLPPP